MLRWKTLLVASALWGCFAAPSRAQVSGVTVTLVASPNPSYAGQAVTFTASVTGAPGSPEAVTFLIDGTNQASVALDSNSQASFTTASLAVGTHRVVAVFRQLWIASLSQTVYTAGARQFTQQGAKLVGTGGGASSSQGQAVALSADGNTALVAGRGGEIWIFTRTGGMWNQQGTKLLVPGQITSAALSADGNTALVGTPQDGNGGAWVFVRSGSTWTQQGNKLVDPGNGYLQGYGVALSADGNTALIGGATPIYQNGGVAWVFTRSGSNWSEQTGRLAGSDAISINPGGSNNTSVALSGDGNTALVGAAGDNYQNGAAWVFTRSASGWTQQGSKLTGSGAAGGAGQGTSVALSSDGNTALIGGPFDSLDGAAWVFTRTGATWTQQGNKLVGTGRTGITAALQGMSVSLSGDGSTALIGGPQDGSSSLTSNDQVYWSSVGAAWIFTRTDVDWTQLGTKLGGSDSYGGSSQGFSVALSADGSTALIGAPGDGSRSAYGASSIGAAWAFTGSPAATITLSASPNPALLGQPVTFTATVTAGATGTVTFTIDGTPQLFPLIGSQAQLTTSSLAPGNHTISAAYSGDNNFLPVTSNTLTEVVNLPPLTLTLTSAPNPSPFGQAVTFTASLSGGSGDYAGSVQFLDGNTALGSGDVANGQSSFTTSALSAGSHTIVAQYQRTWPSVTESAQGSTTQVVRAPLALTLTSSVNPAAVGQAVMFTAALAGGTGVYSGAVQFLDGNASLGSGTVVNGQASFTTSGLAPGSHTIVAQYERVWLFGTESAQANLTEVVSGPALRLINAAAVIVSGFAPDETVSIFNVSGLNGDLTAPSLPLPISLGGVTVNLTDSAGKSRPAPLYGVFASAGQVNLVVPADTALGPATLTINGPGGSSATAQVSIQRLAPGIFAANANGQGVYAGQVVHAHADGSQTIESSAVFDSSKNAYVAKPVNLGPAGDQVYLVLYGTGIRHRASQDSVVVTMNGIRAPALSAAQGTWPGLDQVNVQVPPSLAGAGIVDVLITVEGQPANPVQVMIQ